MIRMKMSKSKIQTYINCPLQFKLQYINELPSDTMWYKRGRDVHRICEKFFDFTNPNRIQQNPREEMMKIVKMLAGSDWEAYKIYLENFVNLEEEMWHFKTKGSWRPVLREKYINLGYLSGIIDRVDYIQKGDFFELGRKAVFDKEGFYLLDYKSSPAKALKHHMLEMSIYVHLFEQATGIRAAKVGIIFLKDMGVRIGEVTDEDIACALDLMKKVNERVEAEEFDGVYYDAKVCYWCPFRQTCEKLAKGETLNKEKFGGL